MCNNVGEDLSAYIAKSRRKLQGATADRIWALLVPIGYAVWSFSIASLFLFFFFFFFRQATHRPSDAPNLAVV